MSHIWCMAFVWPQKFSIILFFPIYWRRYCKSHRFEIRAIFWLLIFQAPFPKLSWFARKNFDPNHLWLKSEPCSRTTPLKTICKTVTTFLCPFIWERIIPPCYANSQVLLWYFELTDFQIQIIKNGLFSWLNFTMLKTPQTQQHGFLGLFWKTYWSHCWDKSTITMTYLRYKLYMKRSQHCYLE